MTEIEERRKVLVDIIIGLKEDLKRFLDDIVAKAGMEAGTGFLENLTKHESAETRAQIEELKKQISEKNNTQGTGNWYIDMAIFLGTGLAGPIAGHLMEKALNKGLGVLFNRMAKERMNVIEQNRIIDSINSKYAGSWTRVKLKEYSKDEKKKLRDVWLEIESAPALARKNEVPSEPYFTKQQFVEHVSPIGNDTLQNYTNKILDARAGIQSKKSSKPNTEDETKFGVYQYTVLERLEEQLSNMPATYVQRIMNNYVTTTKFDSDKNFDQKLHFIEQEVDIEVINKMIKNYTDKKKEISENLNEKYKVRLAQLLESIMWSYYLGDANNWASSLDDTNKWYIEKQDYVDRFDFKKKSVKAFALNCKPGIGAVLDSLAKHFYYDEDKKISYYHKCREDKEKGIHTDSGAGIDHGWTIKDWSMDKTRERPEKWVGDPSSFDYNLRDYIRYKMQSYFKEFQKSMRQGEVDLLNIMGPKFKRLNLPSPISKDFKKL